MSLGYEPKPSARTPVSSIAPAVDVLQRVLAVGNAYKITEAIAKMPPEVKNLAWLPALDQTSWWLIFCVVTHLVERREQYQEPITREKLLAGLVLERVQELAASPYASKNATAIATDYLERIPVAAAPQMHIGIQRHASLAIARCQWP